MNTEQTNNTTAHPAIARELTLLALCDAYLAAGLSALHALSSAQADYTAGLRIQNL